MWVNCGIADDDIDPISGLAGSVDHRLQFSFSSDIAGDSQYLKALAGKFLGCRFDTVLVAARDHDPGTVLSHCPSDCFADSLGRAGHDGCLTAEIEQIRHAGAPTRRWPVA